MEDDDLESRVQRGIILLRTRESEETETPEGMRKVHPRLKGWPVKINRDLLDLAEPHLCIIDGLAELGISLHDAARAGLYLWPDEDVEYDDLTEVWRERLARMPEVQAAEEKR